jgi:hypothetical protein
LQQSHAMSTSTCLEGVEHRVAVLLGHRPVPNILVDLVVHALDGAVAVAVVCVLRGDVVVNCPNVVEGAVAQGAIHARVDDEPVHQLLGSGASGRGRVRDGASTQHKGRRATRRVVPGTRRTRARTCRQWAACSPEGALVAWDCSRAGGGVISCEVVNMK